MKRISNILFSMETMGFLILIFAASIGVATFIENDYGIPASKSVVYNAMWFNILLLWLGLNLIANIFRYKMYSRKKLTLFLFHIAFLIILIGSAITRFVSYEGTMHIREGNSSNAIVSDETFVQMWLNDGNNETYDEDKILLSVLRPNSFAANAKIGSKKIKFEKENVRRRSIIVRYRTKERGLSIMIVF